MACPPKQSEGRNPAHVAQSAERVLGKDEVTSSILVVGSTECVKLLGIIEVRAK